MLNRKSYSTSLSLGPPSWRQCSTYQRAAYAFFSLCATLIVYCLYSSWHDKVVYRRMIFEWGQDLSSSTLIADLEPFPPRIPFSRNKGKDSVYHLGSASYTNYTEELDQFVAVVFPPLLRDAYRSEQVGGWDSEGGKKIWQTDKDESHANGKEVKSWKDMAAREDWDWQFLTDEQANNWVQHHWKGTRLETIWNTFPTKILNADLLRYLLLTVHGGIYSDVDTVLLTEPKYWGQGADLWSNGEGWISNEDINQLESFHGGDGMRDAEINRLLGRASVIVGIEADADELEGWASIWPRPLQITQWTMASRPYHPIFISCLLRILHNTATAIDLAQARHESLVIPDTDILTVPERGGPLGVLEWTGPSVFTDAVLDYLRARYGLAWRDLKGLTRPLRVGDVIILPSTGFSPGTKYSAGKTDDKEAMVQHEFRGSWKYRGQS